MILIKSVKFCICKNQITLLVLVEMLEPIKNKIKPTSTNSVYNENFDERADIQSRSSVVLSDLASRKADKIAENDGIQPLVELLQTNVGAYL